FTDDLDAVAPGLVATGTPLPDVCGLGSSLTGTSTITLADGGLTGGASCTFSVDVVIPDVSSGTYVNVTSALSSEVGGASVPGDPADAAIASLVIANLIIEVPTLGTWGLIAMAALLALFAVGRMRLD
ncbi:MAG: IPTL-CTERM sorting domain-containing protein, partial [Acidobacteriota bacterium]